MLRIHKPIACLLGAVILLVSVYFFRTAYLVGSVEGEIKQEALSSVGMVLGVLTILYGLIPGRTKE
jgi:hypothetical protein